MSRLWDTSQIYVRTEVDELLNDYPGAPGMVIREHDGVRLLQSRRGAFRFGSNS